MTFLKTAKVDILGVSSIKNGKANDYRRVTASRKTSSFYMDGGMSLDSESLINLGRKNLRSNLLHMWESLKVG